MRKSITKKIKIPIKLIGDKNILTSYKISTLKPPKYNYILVNYSIKVDQLNIDGSPINTNDSV